jgi:hypothetical protein
MTDVVDTRRIDPAELEYHRRMVERAKWAKAAAREVVAVDAACSEWAKYLHEKYEIEPGQAVDENGEIRTVE